MQPPMKPIILIPSLFIFVFITINYQALLGVFGAKLETWKLRQNTPGRIIGDNPPNAADFFQDNLSEAWETRVINGSGSVNSGLEFGAGKFELRDGSLLMYLRKDLDFENKPPSKRYNNVALIGFRGYSPAPGRVLWREQTCRRASAFSELLGLSLNRFIPYSKTAPSRRMHRSTCLVLPLSVRKSDIYGYSGAVCSLALNWWPSASSLGNIDIYELHTYEVRLQWQSERSWIGIISVDGAERCRMELPPFGFSRSPNMVRWI